MGEKEFFRLVNAEGTWRLRVRMLTRRGKVIEFTVQLEVLSGDTWQAVVRYDNSHGFPHRDELSYGGKILRKIPLPLTLEEVVEYAQRDLEDRAEWYVERFLKG